MTTPNSYAGSSIAHDPYDAKMQRQMEVDYAAMDAQREIDITRIAHASVVKAEIVKLSATLREAPAAAKFRATAFGGVERYEQLAYEIGTLTAAIQEASRVLEAAAVLL